jgi:hypothetical protein
VAQKGGKYMAIIVRQQPDLTAYEEGQADGNMRREVLESRSYPYVRDGYQGPSTLGEAVSQERQNVEEFLQDVAADPQSDPEDIAYLNGKLSSYPGGLS